MRRRTFVNQALQGTTFLAMTPLAMAGCNTSKQVTSHADDLKISLAQWSLNKALAAKKIEAIDFPKIAKEEFDISAVEYVNQFYVEHGSDDGYWRALKKMTDDLGVDNLLIMVDDEGDLGDPHADKRKHAVENHHKWVRAAKLLDCHSIRVNAFGADNKAEIRSALVEGMGMLCEYSAQYKIHVLIENHGLFSSDARFITEVIEEVDNPYLGTLPDFGNWCLSEKWGSTRLDNCENVYDRYQGVKEFLPYAQGVSAKSYDFTDAGDQKIIDYRKMLKIVRDFGYRGYIGIEYEGENLSEDAGIKATKKLLETIWSELSP